MDYGDTIIFSEKGYKVYRDHRGLFGVITPQHPHGLNANPWPDAEGARKWIVKKMKEDGVYGKGSFGNSFQNGRARAEQEISNKMMNAGVKVENAIDDKSMKEKGYTYKITLPPGMGEPLYAKSFNAAKEMAKEYGTGTKVEELK